MAKLKTIYVCQECGTTSPKWMGKCNNCNAWNTYVEEIVESTPKNVVHKKNNTAPQLIETIQAEARPRIQLADQELNRVLGGGIVQGSLVLIGGEPGIGKSTLLLQDVLQTKNLKTLYVSGEESESQIKMRAERIASINKDIYIYTETDAESIIQQMQQIQPDIVVIDSIQTIQTALLDSAPGSVAQIRESTYLLQQYAKKHHVPIFIVGHITKDGVIAGPKLLEHIVDCVLQFEGDRNYNYRIIRTIKNRFGSTAELGIYEMQSSGLRAVSNPSELLITEREDEVSGVAIAITMEGNRAMLIEVQALVSSAVYGTPQRSSTGYDLRRLNMILAVLDKRCGFRFGSKDVFLNIAGGLKIDDPSADLAVVAALLSSYDDIALSNEICFSGEVGLSGEIRAVNKIDIRIAEAAKLGYKNIYISKYNHKIEPNTSKIRLSKTVLDFYKSLF
ncbi:MAG: DNA repair protein RadA [Sphingobacteriales bacterium]|nr:MAG: DNA repair protein RadA [Sphingobacteriales bacterium]